jgi:hypothetical protein
MEVQVYAHDINELLSCIILFLNSNIILSKYL